MEPALASAKLETQTLTAAWATEKAKLNADAATVLQNAILDVRKEEAKRQADFAVAEAKYRKTIKDLQDEKTAATSVSTAGGLWVETVGASCTQHPSDTNAVPSTTTSTSGLGATIRCRLAPTTAEALIEIANQADLKIALLNKCIAELNKGAP